MMESLFTLRTHGDMFDTCDLFRTYCRLTDVAIIELDLDERKDCIAPLITFLIILKKWDNVTDHLTQQYINENNFKSLLMHKLNVHGSIFKEGRSHITYQSLGCVIINSHERSDKFYNDLFHPSRVDVEDKLNNTEMWVNIPYAE